MTTDTDHIETASVSVSTTLSTSASKATVECPECKKELQTRYMFNHIFKLHPYYFSSMLKVWDEDKLNELAKTAQSIPVEWEYQNDFEETEFKQLWGCLACHSTFTVEHKANHHTANAKCKAKHVTGIKQIIKDEKKHKEKRLKEVNTSRYKWENRSAHDVYLDTLNTILVAKNKIYGEYLPYVERLYTQHLTIPMPIFPSIPTITENNDKRFQVEQENKVVSWMNTLESIVKNHLRELPISVVSDEKYEFLERYSSLYTYVRLTTENNKALADSLKFPDGYRINWGYMTCVL